MAAKQVAEPQIVKALRKLGTADRLPSVPAVARELGVETSQLRDLYKAEVVAFPSLKLKPTPTEAKRARESGLRFERIAVRMGVSESKVRELLEKAGVDPKAYVGRGRRWDSSAPRNAKAQPLSMRLGEAASLLVGDESRRSRRSRSAVVEELAEEAAKARLFPGIAFRGTPRRAWVIGSGLDVWEIVDLLRSYGDDEKRLREDHPLVNERHVRLARAYAERFPQEVDAFLEAGRRPLEDLLSLYPFLQAER